MRHRNRNLRVLLTVAALVVALGATQAAVVLPAPQDGQQRYLSSYKRQGNPNQGFWMGTVYFFRFTTVLNPGRPPLFMPPNSNGTPKVLGNSDVPVVENLGRKMVDGGEPI